MGIINSRKSNYEQKIELMCYNMTIFVFNLSNEMSLEQLRAIYTAPKIISDQAPLEQVKELAEIGFDEDLRKFVESNKSYFTMSTEFSSAKDGWKFLEFLDNLIQVLASVKKEKIKTEVIRHQYGYYQFLSNQPASRQRFGQMPKVNDDSNLPDNVIMRLHAFIEKLKDLQSEHQAKNLVRETKEEAEIDKNRNILLSQQSTYLNLLSSSLTSLKSWDGFERSLNLLSVETFLPKLQRLAKRIFIMSEIMKDCESSTVEEKVSEELSELNELKINLESIMEQATDLKNLTALFKKIKAVEDTVIKKADELSMPKDAHHLAEFIQFVEGKKIEIQQIKEKINGISGIHQRTRQAIEKIEESIQQKMEEAELEALRQAKSLVKQTKELVEASQENLSSIQSVCLELLSSSETTQKSCDELNGSLVLLSDENLSSQLRLFDERKIIMDALMEDCKEISVGELMSEEQSELIRQIENFKSIMEQAADLKKISALFKQIKIIEEAVTCKTDELLHEDAKKLEQFIQFIEDKERELHSIKKGIESTSDTHQQLFQAIEKIEIAIQQKKLKAVSLLQQIGNASRESLQKEELPDQVSTPKKISPVVVEIEEMHQPTTPPIEKTKQAIPQGTKQDVSLLPQNDQQKEELSDRDSLNSTSNGEQPPMQSDQLSEKALEDKRKRLEEAISLISMYKGTLEYEKKHSVKFFHKSRNQAKIDYCLSLEKNLRKQMESLNSTSNLLDIINEAHNSLTQGSIDDLTKGGSYFGTSRMLSLQRLLGVNEAWAMKGHSKFLGFSTSFDFHGLKASGMVGKHAQIIVNNFYNETVESYGDYQTLKKQVFPEEAVNKSKFNP